MGGLRYPGGDRVRGDIPRSAVGGFGGRVDGGEGLRRTVDLYERRGGAKGLEGKEGLVQH